jgi:hypothetical protein
MKKYNRKDNDGHKYNVPLNLLDFFDTQMELIIKAKRFTSEWYEANDRFNYYFEEYMVG